MKTTKKEKKESSFDFQAEKLKSVSS